MKVVELLPQLCLLRFPVGNAYLWRDATGLTLIDTGVSGSAPLIGKAIEELGYGCGSGKGAPGGCLTRS